MSLPQGAEISLAYVDFLATHVGVFDDIRWGPAYTNGTRVFAREDGVWRAFLLTDLTSPARFPSSTFKIERLDSVSVTIPANTASAFATYTISPALPDVIGNYKVFTTVKANTAANWGAICNLINTANLRVYCFVYPSFLGVSNMTGVTVAGTSLTSVTLSPAPPGDYHGGSDSGASQTHLHEGLAHTVTDPGHSHTINLNTAGATINVDLMIIHI